MSERTKASVSPGSWLGAGAWGDSALTVAMTSSSPIRSSRSRISASGR